MRVFFFDLLVTLLLQLFGVVAMKIFSLGAILLSLMSVTASANALHLNPQQVGDRANMKTFGRTSIPIGYIGYCERWSIGYRSEARLCRLFILSIVQWVPQTVEKDAI